MHFDPKFFSHVQADPFVIEDGFDIRGSITCSNGRPMVFDGTIHGDIISNGAVLIGENGRVVGSVKAQDLELRGQVARRVDGDVLEVENTLRMTATAVASIDVVAPRFSMARGADMRGNINEINRPMVVEALQSVEPALSAAARAKAVEPPTYQRPESRHDARTDSSLRQESRAAVVEPTTPAMPVAQPAAAAVASASYVTQIPAPVAAPSAVAAAVAAIPTVTPAPVSDEPAVAPARRAGSASGLQAALDTAQKVQDDSFFRNK